MEGLRHIELMEDRFGFEDEVTAKVAKGCRFAHEILVPHRRTNVEGKKVTRKNGLRGTRRSVNHNLVDWAEGLWRPVRVADRA